MRTLYISVILVLISWNTLYSQIDTIQYIRVKTYKIISGESLLTSAFRLDRADFRNYYPDRATDKFFKSSSLNYSDIFDAKISKVDFFFPDSNYLAYTIEYVLDDSIILRTGIDENNLFINNSNRMVVFLDKNDLRKMFTMYDYQGNVLSSINQNSIYLLYKDYGFSRQSIKQCLYLMYYSDGVVNISFVKEDDKEILFNASFIDGKSINYIYKKNIDEILSQ